MPPRLPELCRIPVLLAGAWVCALVANGLAPAHRRLAWTGWVPPATLGRSAPPASLAAPAGAAPRPTATGAAFRTPSAASDAGASHPGPHPGPDPSQGPGQSSGPGSGPGAGPSRAPGAARPAAPGGSRFAAAADTAIREITGSDAWAAFQSRLPFLDARRSEEFGSGHVPGAHSAPVWEADLDTRITQFEATANPAPRDPIVIYCGGGGCEDSHLLARKLVALGYRNLLIYREGFPDWVAQGHPQARGTRP